MNILNYSESQLEQMVRDGIIKIAVLKQYRICKAIAEKKEKGEVMDKMDISYRYVHKVVSQHCPECRN